VREADAFVVTPPPHRFDLEIEEDLIEEIARLWGFERIPANPPRSRAAMRAEREDSRSLHAIRRELALAGYQELVNFSFVDAEWERDLCGNGNPINVLNPIATRFAVMRTSLLGGLVAALKYNLNRKASRIFVFEIGRVFLRDGDAVDGPLAVAGTCQPLQVAGLAYGPSTDEQWGERKRDVDFYDVKGNVERLIGAGVRFVTAEHPALHPGRSARIVRDGLELGWIGELHPRWQQKFELPKAPVVFELDAEALQVVAVPMARPIPRFPAVIRDIALVVDDTITVQQILDAVDDLNRKDKRPEVLREFRLFDLYRAAGDSGKAAAVGASALSGKEKSLAFRIVLQDTERTLSDADADASVAVILAELTSRLGAKLRR
jgi:phenylalanyl-tRNA synthetase beta chain